MSILKKLLLVGLILMRVSVQSQTLKDGLTAWGNENYISAREIFKKVSEAEPTNATAAFYYGQVLFKLGDVNGSKASFDKGALARPTEFLCLVGQAKCMLDAGDVLNADKKIASVLKATKSKDSDVLRYIAEAYATNKNKDWAKAIDYATQAAVSIKGKTDFNTFNTLGDVYFDKHYSGNGEDKDIGNAVTNYEKAYQLNPASPYAMTRVGKIWSTTRMEQSYKLTIDALDKANAVKPDYLPLHSVYAFIYEKTGQYEKAKTEQQIYMSGCDDKIKPNDRMINILYKLKDWNGTLTLAKKMNEVLPGNCDYVRVLAQVNTELGNHAEAIKFFNQYLSKCDLSKMDIDDYNYLAKSNRGVGNDSASIRYYYKVIGLDSSKEQSILKEIANGFYSARKYDLAINSFKNLLAKYPTPNALYKLMDCYYLAKKWNETNISADTFIVQNGSNPIGYLYKAKALYYLDTLNDRKASADMYKTFLDKASDTAFSKAVLKSDLIEANGQLMQYSIRKNDYKKALEFCEIVLKIDPSNTRFLDFKTKLEKRINTANMPAKPAEKPKATENTKTPSPKK